MNTFTKLLAAAVFSASVAITAQETKTFTIDTVHSHMGFKIKHLSISNVAGNFKTFSGSWVVDTKTNDLKELEGTIKVKSIDTDNEKRDEHLRKPDFFDAEKFPDMTFKLKNFLPSGKIGGDLTIKGITKTAIWDVTVTKIIDNPFDKGKTLKQGLSITGTINRKDFNIGMTYGNEVISDLVTISLELEGDSPAAK